MHFCRTAVMIDGAFFLNCLFRERPCLEPAPIHAFGKNDLDAAEKNAAYVANLMQSYIVKHCWQKTGQKDSCGNTIYKNIDLYRIFFYDCPPLEKRMHFPVSGKNINFATTPQAVFRRCLHKKILRQRKTALRLGHLADTVSWRFKGDSKKGVQQEIINGKTRFEDRDFEINTRQKGVDMRLGIDIASLAYKKLVSQIILIAGDSDFVPAAKLARREGIDIVVDSLGEHIHDKLQEHIDGMQSHWRHLPEMPDKIIEAENAECPAESGGVSAA